jgi:uncharacterized protein with ParB-like and HNH nuclease domain
MPAVDIKSDILTVAELFNDFYDVPDYQRDYVWQDEHIEQLLDDVKNALDDNRSNYFLGTIVVNKRSSDSIYELIDGQQRLTTIVLVMCAMQHYMVAHQIKPYSKLEVMLLGNPSFTDDKTRNRLLPQYHESKEFLHYLARNNGINLNEYFINNAADEDIQTILVNLVRGYRTIMQWLNANYPQFELFKSFYKFFVSDILFIRIQTKNMEEALRLFESINERGVRLDSVDLLKNMLFTHTPEAEYLELREKWTQIVRIVQQSTLKESTIRFIRYVVMAEYLRETDALVREHELYTWFNKHTTLTNHETKPQVFVKMLQDRAKQYVAIRNGNTTNNSYCDGVSNVRLLSSSIRQHIPCMLAAQHMPDHDQQQLATILEQTEFVIVFTASPAQVLEKQLTWLTSHIRVCQSAQDIQAIRAHLYTQILEPRLAEFTTRMHAFSPARLKANVMRYMLARVTRAMMRNDQTPLEEYLKAVDVCPLLPPLPGVHNLSPDQVAQYQRAAQSIGNYVLIEKKLAKDVRSGKITSFDALAQSKLSYNLRMMNASDGNAFMHRVPGRWDAATISDRTAFIVDVARKLWGFA